VADFGHWGDGGIHCNLVLPPGDRHDEGTARRLRDLVLGTVVDDFGGSFSAEHGIGPHNADWWLATVPAPVQQLTRGIKALVDPLDVLGHPGLPYG
jgi:FAD/FMN-containing dehydrogenase